MHTRCERSFISIGFFFIVCVCFSLLFFQTLCHVPQKVITLYVSNYDSVYYTYINLIFKLKY